MKRYWITAVMVGMLALAVSVPAWAACKAEAKLCPTTGCTLTSASGVAEAKVVTANALLRIKAVNKFDADVHGLASENPYKVTAFGASGGENAHAYFFTDTAGSADVDIRDLSTTCDIKSGFCLYRL